MQRQDTRTSSLATGLRTWLAIATGTALTANAHAQEVVQIPAAEVAPSETACPPPDGTRPDATLVNTDAFVLARFPLQRLFSQIVRLAHVVSPSASDLYQQMWDSMDTKAAAKFKAPHCDDADPPSINGFPIECSRPEAVLKNSSPATFVPVALTNRFDLSPADGANCGEYRIIYAMTPFDEVNRNLIIVEGVLPNPDPSCGLEACRPVAQFWHDLAALNPKTYAGKKALADRLEQFYFYGLPGFSPVVHPNHYGMEGRGGYGGANGGQIRTNMFVSGTTWQMREFRVARRCTGKLCRLLLEPASVKSNPFAPLFDMLNPSPDARAHEFQTTFPSQVAALVNDDINLISLNMDDRFNAGQSTSSDINEDYVTQAIQGLANGPNALTTALRGELTRLGRSEVTPLDVVERAMTQSCAGCHMLARNVGLSGDGTRAPVWPDVRPGGFVHIDEHGFLSPALWCSFLPHRKTVLDGFVASPARSCDPSSAQHEPPVTIVSHRALPPIKSTSSLPVTVTGKPFGPN